MLAIWGNGPSVPKTHLPKFCSAVEFVKGKGEVISVIDVGSQSRRHPSPCAGLSAPCDSPLGALLFTQFVREIAERKAREEIWSSADYLFFISNLIYGKNQQIRQGVV